MSFKPNQDFNKSKAKGTMLLMCKCSFKNNLSEKVGSLRLIPAQEISKHQGEKSRNLIKTSICPLLFQSNASFYQQILLKLHTPT